MNKATVFLILFFFTSCSKDYQKIDLTINRFDRDLFEINNSNKEEIVSTLKKRYGSFYDVFESKIINRGDLSHDRLYEEIISFTQHRDMKEAYDSIQKVFPELSEIEQELGIAFWNFSKYFPLIETPNLVAFFSGFNYGVITFDDYIAIGLENFLGENSKFYSHIGEPHFLRFQKQVRFISPNVVEVWLNEHFQSHLTGRDLLSQIVYKGKIMYCIDKILPHRSLADKFRFSDDEMNWAKNNESEIWKYIINNDLLFSLDEKRYRSYINYSPFSKGMPDDSPGRIGYYIGYKIVNSFMKNSEFDFEQLMNNNDSRYLLNESRYKPKK